MYLKAIQGESYRDISRQTNRTPVAVRSSIQRFYQENTLPSPSMFGKLTPTEQTRLIASLAEQEDVEDGYPSYVRIFDSGEREIQQVVDGTQEQLNDKFFLCEKLGLDPEQWDIKEASMSKWGTEYDYRTSVRVRVSPITNKVDYEKLFKDFAQVIIPHEPDPIKSTALHENTLVIPLFDLHAQVSDTGLKDKFREIRAKVATQAYRNIHIIFGGDGLEHDNFVATTESGTRTEDTNIHEDYVMLYSELALLLRSCYFWADNTHFTYLRGNHSPSLDWAMSHALKVYCANMPDVSFDIDKDKLVKGVLDDEVFIGMFHGQKQFKKDQLVPQFIAKFPMEWSSAKTRIIFSGHYHSEKEVQYNLIDDLGSASWHQQPSPKPSNNWAENNNFMSHFVGIKLYEFNGEKLKGIYYV